MKTKHSLVLSLLLAALGLGAPGFMLPAQAETAAAPQADALRAPMFKLAKAGDLLITDKKYPEALQNLKEMEALADKTPYELFYIESMRATIAQAINDNVMAIKAFEALLASGRMSAAEQIKLTNQLGVRNYQLKNYPQAVVWLKRTLKEGGDERKVRVLLAQAQYLANDYAGATTELRSIIEADEKAGVKPDFDLLNLFGSAVLKAGDKAGYVEALEKFVAYYPKKEYWIDLLQRVETKPGFPERLLLDLLRLQFASGSMSTGAEYTEMAEAALLAGFPAEAKNIMDQGYLANVMGEGTPADVKNRQKLREKINKNASDDLKTMANGEADANKPGKDGNALVNLGYAYVLTGQYERGLSLMERGIAKGLGKRGEDGKLHLGMALAQAGRKDDAIKMLRTVSGTEGCAELARYWILHLNKPAK